MEDVIFPRPAVSRILIEKFVEARLHTDHETKGSEWIALERRYVGFQAQPYYVVFDPKTRKPLRIRNFTEDEPALLRFLLGERAGP